MKGSYIVRGYFDGIMLDTEEVVCFLGVFRLVRDSGTYRLGFWEYRRGIWFLVWGFREGFKRDEFLVGV